MSLLWLKDGCVDWWSVVGCFLLRKQTIQRGKAKASVELVLFLACRATVVAWCPACFICLVRSISFLKRKETNAQANQIHCAPSLPSLRGLHLLFSFSSIHKWINSKEEQREEKTFHSFGWCCCSLSFAEQWRELPPLTHKETKQPHSFHYSLSWAIPRSIQKEFQFQH